MGGLLSPIPRHLLRPTLQPALQVVIINRTIQGRHARVMNGSVSHAETTSCGYYLEGVTLSATDT